MEKNSIPNIQINQTKINKTPYFDGRVLVELPQWIGYWNNHECTERIKEGQFWIAIENDIASHESFSTNQGQVNAFYYLIEKQDKIKQEIIKSLKLFLSNAISNEYADWDQADFPKLSDLTPEFDFKNHIGPSGITIEREVKDGIAYLMWHFYCLWDPEHGFEVITHKDRVIDIGQQADGFKIYEDNGTADEVTKRVDERLSKMKEKKKWWKFW